MSLGKVRLFLREMNENRVIKREKPERRPRFWQSGVLFCGRYEKLAAGPGSLPAFVFLVLQHAGDDGDGA